LGNIEKVGGGGEMSGFRDEGWVGGERTDDEPRMFCICGIFAKVGGGAD